MVKRKVHTRTIPEKYEIPEKKPIEEKSELQSQINMKFQNGRYLDGIMDTLRFTM